MQLPTYTTLFSCLYDEPSPIGHLGCGTHYSVFRSVEWLDVTRTPVPLPQIHDFAVIWDDDHDTRIIETIEAIYMAGLLSPIQFIGERKGTLTVIVAAKFYFWGSDADLNSYERQLQKICENPGHGDNWELEVGMFDRSPGSPHQTELHGLISAEEHRVITYLRNIDSLWGLGTKPFTQKRYPNPFPTMPAPSLPPLPSIPPLPARSFFPEA
ncbi:MULTISPECIES: hypothetical protein [Pseudomonas]|uniref:hypothetical protein n=1 Tax=Pseudomonas TaxID=286 RepID=UPI000AEED300|nr:MULTISPECIES: hypothetical protein [Pseudomonas]